MSENLLPGFPLDRPGEKVPMHPEDFVALLAGVGGSLRERKWVRIIS